MQISIKFCQILTYTHHVRTRAITRCTPTFFGHSQSAGGCWTRGYRNGEVQPRGQSEGRGRAGEKEMLVMGSGRVTGADGQTQPGNTTECLMGRRRVADAKQRRNVLQGAGLFGAMTGFREISTNNPPQALTQVAAQLLRENWSIVEDLFRAAVATLQHLKKRSQPCGPENSNPENSNPKRICKNASHFPKPPRVRVAVTV